MALLFAIIVIPTDAVLGPRCTLAVLPPAAILATLFAVIAGVANGDGLWRVTLMTWVLVTVVEVGYMAGAALRFTVESILAARARRRESPELGKSGPSRARPDGLGTLCVERARPVYAEICDCGDRPR